MPGVPLRTIRSSFNGHRELPPNLISSLAHLLALGILSQLLNLWNRWLCELARGANGLEPAKTHLIVSITEYAQ